VRRHLPGPCGAEPVIFGPIADRRESPNLPSDLRL
jgi:hypothetical protein